MASGGPEPETSRVLKFSREVLKPESWDDPKGYVDGLKTKGGRRIEIAGFPSQEVLHNSPTDMAAQMDDSLAIMLADLTAKGGSRDDIVMLTMQVAEAQMYRDARRSLGESWVRHFDKFYPTKLIANTPTSQDAPVITTSITALVDAPPEESEGITIWLAGQNGFRQNGKINDRDDVEIQTLLTMQRLEAVLQAGNGSFRTASSVCLRMFIDPLLYEANKAAILYQIASVAGEKVTEQLQVYPAIGFFEKSALVEMDGYAGLAA